MSRTSLAALLPPERIKIPVESRDKAGVIEEMSRFLARVAGASEEEGEAIQEAVLEREAVLSTGIGGGVALPHGKSEALKELVLVAGRTAEPVDFDALDEQPVRLVLMLVGPDASASEHVTVLSRVGRVLRRASVREALLEAESPQAFQRAVAAAEEIG